LPACPSTSPNPPSLLASESSWLLRYARSFPGRCDQVREVRGFLREVLADRPRVDDAVMVGSELAANACLHSRSSAPGALFTVRIEVSEGDHIYVAVQDDGGLWQPCSRGREPRHGLDLVQALAGSANWGIEGEHDGRLIWARLYWSNTGRPTAPTARKGSASA
jgi:serine/threonine-protein kinase RsbW